MLMFQFETSKGIDMGKTLQNRRGNQRFIMERDSELSANQWSISGVCMIRYIGFDKISGNVT